MANYQPSESLSSIKNDTQIPILSKPTASMAKESSHILKIWGGHKNVIVHIFTYNLLILNTLCNTF